MMMPEVLMTRQACKTPPLQHSCMDVVRDLSTPSNKPHPALNIVMYCKEINKTHKKQKKTKKNA
jgi:hypothetical protein